MVVSIFFGAGDFLIDSLGFACSFIISLIFSILISTPFSEFNATLVLASYVVLEQVSQIIRFLKQIWHKTEFMIISKF